MRWLKEKDMFELNRDEMNDLIDLIGVIDRDKKYQKDISGWKKLSKTYKKAENLLVDTGLKLVI